MNGVASPGVYDKDVTGPGVDRPSAFDAAALDQLVALRTFARRLVQNRTDADDLVQDVYVHALRAAGSFTPGTNLRAWLRTILTNLVKNRRRDLARARVRIDEEEVARAASSRTSGQVSPEQLLLNDDVEPRLKQALASMPKALRDAVWLRDVEEMTYAEIASRLRVPPGTVMSRISRGRRLLHDRLIARDMTRGVSRGRR